MTKTRRTRQLSAVLDAVSSSQNHPSADEVYACVRRQLPFVSLGTVYRNLQKLVAQRQLKVVQLTNRVTRYDAVLGDHDHFVCERCNRVTDLLPRQERPACAPLEHAGFSIRAHALTFYGACPTCQRQGGRDAASDPGVDPSDVRNPID